MELIYRLIGFRIEIQREKSGMTQEQLAEKISIDRTSIANIEGGKQRIQLHSIKEIAVALGVRPQELLKGVWED